MKFRKKPVVIEAEQFLKDKLPYPDGVYVGGSYCSTQGGEEWCELHQLHHLIPHYKIDTLEGLHIVSHCDWIITGVQGERYPCKPDIFEQTYEEVMEECK
ncbi:hypothetical protein LCGC14_2668150 [marine sediment metagenome]|uniref:Phage protein n=1 Tax=marine sediment metagenome TaxID=412755 RepID=A0A0F9ACB9_9ZZZZ